MEHLAPCFLCGGPLPPGCGIAVRPSGAARPAGTSVRLHQACAAHLAGRLLSTLVRTVPAEERQGVMQVEAEPGLRLTPRQRDILHRMSRGESNAEIACGLGLTPGYVSNVVSEILQELGARSRTEAALKAVQYRLVRSQEAGGRVED